MDTRIGHLERSTAQDRSPETKNPEVKGQVALQGVGVSPKMEFTEWGDFRGLHERPDAAELVNYYPGPGGSAEYNLKGW